MVKQPIYKKWWFWTIIGVITLISIFAMFTFTKPVTSYNEFVMKCGLTGGEINEVHQIQNPELYPILDYTICVCPADWEEYFYHEVKLIEWEGCLKWGDV